MRQSPEFRVQSSEFSSTPHLWGSRRGACEARRCDGGELYPLFMALFLCILLTSCGFTPLYSEQSAISVPVQAALAKVRVANIPAGRDGQLLKTELENLLIKQGEAKTHELRIDLSRQRQELNIQQDREVTRFSLTVDASLALVDISNGEVVWRDRSQIIGSFDAADTSDFATYAAEQDTNNRILKEMAQDIRFRLVNYLAGDGLDG